MKQLKQKKAKRIKIKQVIYMIISLFTTIFIITQVFFLTKYTLGYEIKSNQLILYKWINKIEGRELKKTYIKNVEK